MSNDFLGDRRKALEESFFAKRDQELLAKLSVQVAGEAKSKALSAASGVTDTKVLDHLLAMNIGVETLAALCLVPLVQVAWADGNVATKEREAILAAAADAGIKSGEASYQLLEEWLKKMPEDELLKVWKEYISALRQTLDAAVYTDLKNDLLGRAKQIAEAAGGILGLGNKTSAAEQKVLDDLSQAFNS